MRSVVAAEFLRAGSPTAVVVAVRALISTDNRASDPDCLATAEAVTAALTSPDSLSYERRAELYTAATNEGATEVARMFFSASPGDEETEESFLAPERRVVPHGRVLTLGERKSLARTHRRDLIMHLVRDPHPDVIAVLLDNPHITERDVVTLAAKRPAPGAAQERIARHQRWRVRYAVKRALVMNPYTPLHLSLRLAATLRPADLRSIAGDPSLDELLRTQARELSNTPPDELH